MKHRSPPGKAPSFAAGEASKPPRAPNVAAWRATAVCLLCSNAFFFLRWRAAVVVVVPLRPPRTEARGGGGGGGGNTTSFGDDEEEAEEARWRGAAVVPRPPPSTGEDQEGEKQASMMSSGRGRPRWGAVAVTCCFDGPAWLQRRSSAVVANALTVLPADVAVQIFHRGDESYVRGLGLNPGLLRLVVRGRGRLHWTAFPEALARRKRADLVLSLYLWSEALAEAVLFFGAGGAFCANSPFDFTADFLPQRYLADDTKSLVLVRKTDALEAISAAIAAQPAEKRLVEKQHNPLAWLHHKLPRELVAAATTRDRRANFAYASVNVSAAADPIPFAVVSTLPHLDDADRATLLERCPEVKITFPSLHAPGCFGAKAALDQKRCYASLCVSDPNVGSC